MYDVVVRASGRYLPERVVTNNEFEAFIETTDEWITERTGIKERHYAAPGEQVSDMACHAAKQALARAGWSPDDLEVIVVATVTPDTVFPATAQWLQTKLGNKTAWSFDVNAGCSGFVYALNTAFNMLRSGQHKRALVVGAEKMTALCDYTNRDHCVLFGDGAGCLLLEAVPAEQNKEGYGLKDFYLLSDGGVAELLVQQAGGSNQPPTYASVRDHQHYISMNGREVYKHAVRRMTESVVELLKKENLDKGEIDWYIAHQANARIIEGTQRRLDVPMEKVYVNVDRYGNTTAATLPICLDEMREDGKLTPGQKVIIFTFGAGFTWGSCYMIWGGVK
jgi:3-oxoacyl-[acyl-carrier-protein] synthase III